MEKVVFLKRCIRNASLIRLRLNGVGLCTQNSLKSV